MRGVTPDPRVIAATKRQPEYGKPVGDFRQRRRQPAAHRRWFHQGALMAKTFDAVEKKFGVERWVLIALWGIESDFGAEKDKWDVFRSLATLAYVRYRHPYFRNELLVAMNIMQDGHFARDKMVSSWAGAMGQTQFMPSNVVDYAIDFSGDGKSDIWTNVPDILRLRPAKSPEEGALAARPALGLRGHRAEGLSISCTATTTSPAGSGSACGAPTASRSRRRVTASCSFQRRQGPRFHRDREFRRAEGVQQLRCLRDRGRAPRRPHEWRRRSRRHGRPTTARSRATRASPCRRNCPRSATR